MNRKINVLVVPSDTYGVGLYRSTSPHNNLTKQYGDEFNVTIEYNPQWRNFPWLNTFDIIHVHKGIFPDREGFLNALNYCKIAKITTILDIDDNWDVGPQHPLYLTMQKMHIPEQITENFTKVDFVTTTTDIFASKIKPYNPNVLVFPNAVDPTEDQYQPIKNPSQRLRFGFVMGSSHEKDLEQFKGAIGMLPKEILDKIQIVLCGYDLRGNTNIVNEKNEIIDNRPILPHESVWFTYEKILTENYKTVSAEYRDFLLKFLAGAQWPKVQEEAYRREWTKDVTDFATHYRNVDVLFAPLDRNPFNEVKSELKFIEGGFTHTAVICSKFGPYTIGSENLFMKGGKVNPNGNCILIDPMQGARGWAMAIKTLATKPELIKLLTDNMYNTVKDKYDIRKVTDRRAEWYKSIVQKS